VVRAHEHAYVLHDDFVDLGTMNAKALDTSVVSTHTERGKTKRCWRTGVTHSLHPQHTPAQS